MSKKEIKKKQDFRRVDESSLCISRKKYKNGFKFYDADNSEVTEKKLLKRLKSLIIPPMWQEVQICKWEDGHLQAIGRDAKGRKQYIYHTAYEQKKQEEKFARMKDFGENLADIRTVAHAHLKQKKWNHDKVAALAVCVLDETGIRIGNKSYAERNGTYGLTTLRRKHIDMEDGTITFNYRGKSKIDREVEVDDPKLSKLIIKAAELPGYELFRFKDGSTYKPIDSDDINQYVRRYMGDEFSSKDFRTWVASRNAVEYYPVAKEEFQKTNRRKFANILLRLVADEMGNTPSVCRSYYIHPKVMEKVVEESIEWKGDMHDTPLQTDTLYDSEKYLMKVI